MGEASGGLVGQWRLYLRWSNGRRECVRMSRTLQLPHGEKLWIHPVPGIPTATDRPGWSREAREQWLDANDAPDPAKVFCRLCERIAHYLDFPCQREAGMTATIAVWALLSYVYPAWDAVPYLFIGGPKRSGKSRLLDLLTRIVFRPLTSSNLTAAALFRTLHSQGGVLLYDEAERLRQTRAPEVAELNSMLLAGYKRGGKATRLEPDGDSFNTVSFDVYGPKALACISGLPDALADRCIPLMMLRSPSESDKSRRRIDAEPARWLSLRDDLHALALEHGPTWLELAGRGNVCPAMMNGRDFEKWQPLLSLASWIETHGADGLQQRVQEHALATIEDDAADGTPECDETILLVLADEIRADRTPTAGRVLEKAKEVDAETYRKWTARGVSEHLKRYGIRTNKSHGKKLYARVSLRDLR